MSSDTYTRPERAAEIGQARKVLKRYNAHKRKCGVCAVCLHRSREETFWGRSICKIGENRQHPECERDGKGLRFEADAAVIEGMRDAA